MVKVKPVEEMSLEELLAERESLAAQRTELRLRQNQVEQAIVMMDALKGLPEELRKRITINGAVGAEGGAN